VFRSNLAIDDVLAKGYLRFGTSTRRGASSLSRRLSFRMRITDTDTGDSENGLGGMQVGLVVFGLVAPVLTFILAISGIPENLKIFILVVLAFGYSAICFWPFDLHADARSDLENRRRGSVKLIGHSTRSTKRASSSDRRSSLPICSDCYLAGCRRSFPFRDVRSSRKQSQNRECLK
jgi:hypothetical protein